MNNQNKKLLSTTLASTDRIFPLYKSLLNIIFNHPLGTLNSIIVLGIFLAGYIFHHLVVYKNLPLLGIFCLGLFCYLLGVITTAHIILKPLKKLTEDLNNFPHIRHEEDRTLCDIDLIDHLRSVTVNKVFQLIDASVEITADFEQLRNRYQLITNNIAASVIIQSIDGSISLCSPYSEVLTGYPIEEIYSKGSNFLESIVIPSDRDRYLRAKTVSALGEDMLVRYQIRHKQGFKMWLESRMVPIVDETGTVTATLCVTIDVTDTLNHQKLIEEQNKDLTDFAYMVSHDLKAPIFTIKGMASALLEDHPETITKDAKEYFEYIIEATKRLEHLVSSVIEYSSITNKATEETEVDINNVLKSIVQDLAESIKQTNAQIKIPDNLPMTCGTTVRIYQIFSNLLGNAIKYKSPKRTPIIEVSLANKAADSITINIKDNGLGIPKSKIEDIFRPYHRAHGNEIEGSGIGLACVKKILDKMGGNVAVSSVEDQGSTFSITLPLAIPHAQAVPENLAHYYQ